MSAVRFTDVMPPPPRPGWPGPISFAIEEGSYALFATTPGVARALIRLVVGLREPVEGTVEALGQQPGLLDRWDAQAFRRRVGVGFDDPAGLVSNLTLRMNLVVPMLYSGLADADTAERRAAELLERWGLGRWADARPADVPPEIRKEAVIARAVVREPELLLLDQPTAGLRDRRGSWLLDRCRERAGTIIITTTEREGVQFERADAIIVLDNTGIETTSHEVGVV